MVTNLLLIAFAVAALYQLRRIMAGVQEVTDAVAAARVEIEADKAAIIAEIQRLGLPDEDLAPVLAAVAELGTVLDDVPGVTPAPAPEPEPEPAPEPV